MVKSLYQIPPRTRLGLLNSNLWWTEGVNLLNQGVSYPTGLEFHRKGIKLVDDIWDSSTQDFLPWEEAKGKFNLDEGEEETWVDITCKIADQWCNLLESDEDTAFPGHWLGFYTQGEEDPAFVIR